MIPRGRADFVLGFEPVEAARALPFVSPRTVVYVNTTPVLPFVLAQRTVLEKDQAEYPDVERLCDTIRTATPQVLAFDATRCAVEAGAGQALNMVMLGCLLASGSLPCDAETFWSMAAKRMPPASRETNAKAFRRGVKCGTELPVAGGTRG